ncbi:MAG: AmmeMemoRadiSam system radical SAM enzyme [Deltaproteobacteria bacterium]|nr:AmmeMemoRadiSam system radical SAM enzyme [Deltaproteobacteria bacterium]
MKEALWWETQEDGRILCTLCPRYCKIGEGQVGFCYIRKNIDGKLYSLGYGKSAGFAIDPIEKKPLNHFLPGTAILSFGTAGCNLGCRFCQNWSMSKAKLDDAQSLSAGPEEVVELALKHNVPSIAFTYNDPVIWGEFVIDISRIARERGLKSVMVTAGYITPEARPEVYRYIDAANVDLKAFTERFYHKLTFSHLDPVLDTLKWLKNETDIWFEITNLMIPGENDDPEETKQLCDWVLENLGDSIPLHFTAFHPDFRMMDKPKTPPSTLSRARQIALSTGIKYCYVGNVFDDEGQTTYCPSCGCALIRRSWHDILEYRLVGDHCPCGQKIPGFFLTREKAARRPRAQSILQMQ